MQTSDLDIITQALAEQGYAIYNNFLPSDTITALAEYAQRQQLKGKLKPATTGQQADLLTDSRIRGDNIMWLDEDSPAQCVQVYLDKMQAFKQELNRQLFLNLHELEAHIAIYPPGTGYARHLDQFNQGENSTRQVSCVLYLNDAWQDDFGGQLRLYLDDGNTIDILPLGGTLVTFFSGDFYHEVLSANRQRISLTGWFRRRDNRLI